MPPNDDERRRSEELWLDAKRRDLEELRSRLVNRSNELDEQSIELIQRRAELDGRAERLGTAQAAAEQRERDLAAEAERLAAETAEQRARLQQHYAAEHKKLHSETSAERERLRQATEAHKQAVEFDRQALTARLRQIEQQEQELQRRISRARDDIVHQRAELAELRQTAESRAAAGRKQADEIERERASWAGELDRLLARAGELDRRESDLQERDRAFSGQRQRVEEISRTLGTQRDAIRAEAQQLEAKRHKVASEQAALDTRRANFDKALEGERRKIIRSFDDQRARLERDVRKFDERKADFQKQRDAMAAERGELDEQQRRIERQTAELHAVRQRHESDLQEERDRLAAENKTAQQRLADAEKELAERKSELESFRERVVNYEQAIDERREQLERRIEEVEERDAEIRQRDLALEVEEQELARERDHVETARERLDSIREQRRSELESARLLLRERIERIEQAERATLAAPRLWWLRATVCATVIGGLAAWLWLKYEPAVHRGVAQMALSTISHDPALAAGQHAATLLSPALARDWMTGASLADAWRRALRERRVEAATSIDPPAIALMVNAGDAEIARRLAHDAAEQYAAFVNGVPAEPRLPAAYADLPQRREGAARELKQVRSSQLQAQTLLATVPPFERRDQLLAEVRRLRDEHARTVTGLEQARQRLATLESDTGPARGAVTDEQFEGQIAADESYQADLREFRIESKAFRNELAVGMVPMSREIAPIAAALTNLINIIDQQRAERPPTEIAAVLEDIGARVEEQLAAVARFESLWSEWRKAVDAMDVSEDVVEVVQQQTTADQAARGLVQDTRLLIAAVNEQLDTLKGGAAGATREMVVVTAVRSELARVESARAALEQAARGVGRTTNHRLDAHDMKLRGLRTRLGERREWVRRRLQEQADALAAMRRDDSLSETRRLEEELSQARGTLVVELLNRMDALRGLDEDMLQRRQLEQRIERDAAEITRLETQVARLDAQIEEARRSGPRPDRIATVVPVRVEQIAGVRRTRHAATAAAAAFGGAWLLCVAMLLRNPFRRRSSLSEDLEIESAAPGLIGGA